MMLKKKRTNKNRRNGAGQQNVGTLLNKSTNESKKDDRWVNDLSDYVIKNVQQKSQV